MDLIADIVLDAGKDTLALVPFLFVTYLRSNCWSTWRESVLTTRFVARERPALLWAPCWESFRNAAFPPWRRRSTLGAL